MALTKETLLENISARFGEAVTADAESLDWTAVVIDKTRSHELVQYLRNEENFNFMTDVCGMHLPDNKAEAQFAVVYHMHNWVDNLRIRIKSFLNSENPTIDSVTDLFLSANWQERETYDFYGIEFKNHPDLRRILNMDEMVSFPMRKEFPMEDSGRTDKDDRYFGRIPQTNNVTNN